MSRLLFSFAAFAALLVPAVCLAADGSIKIKFTLDGKAPALPKPKIDKDEAFCGPKVTEDESLKIGKANAIQNIVMYLYVPTGMKAPESAAAIAALTKEVKMDNLGCKFEPRIAAMHTSQTWIIGNPDPIGHNTKADLFANSSFNDLIPAGGSLTKKLTKTESRPMPVACSIHSWMGGYVLVRDNPFFGVSDKDGVLEIKNVPEGKRTFTIWQERAGFVPKAKQGSKEVTWKSGRIEVDVKGTVDLGEFLIPASVFEKKPG